jgi:hypothetical protein
VSVDSYMNLQVGLYPCSLCNPQQCSVSLAGQHSLREDVAIRSGTLSDARGMKMPVHALPHASPSPIENRTQAIVPHTITSPSVQLRSVRHRTASNGRSWPGHQVERFASICDHCTYCRCFRIQDRRLCTWQQMRVACPIVS